MLWAIVQPIAALGLVGGFLVGLGLRVVAQRLGASVLGVRPMPRRTCASLRHDIDPIGVVSLLLAGVGWGRAVADRPRRSSGNGRPLAPPRWRQALAILVGPAVALLVGELMLAAFVLACPADRETLLLNRPSDVVRGVVAPTLVAQLMISAAVGALGFGLLALLPVPPLDGSRLVLLLVGDGSAEPGRVWDLVGSMLLLVVAALPVGRLPPLLTVLDLVGTPLLRVWT